MQINNEKFKRLLVDSGYVAEANFDAVSKEAEKSGKTIEEILLADDLIKDEQLGQLIAEEQGFNFVNLKKEKINEEVLNLVPELMARSKGVVAFSRDKQGFKVGMTNPNDLEVKHLLEKRLGDKIQPFYITDKDFNDAFFQYKASLKDEFANVLKQMDEASLSRQQRDALTVKLVDILLEYGYQNKASDIHVEPYPAKVVVRFRIDGVMHDVLEIKKELAEFIVTRIKILSKMRTDEHQAAQDGKIRYVGTEEKIDIRVSVLPVTYGENVVMRLLSAKSRQFNLLDLGLGEDDLKKVKRAIKNPHGMILATGPTGSGKTTTLYALIKILNKRDVHISTIEDPVEYDIDGVSQIQVNPKTNLTFAQGLRSIVRQDPDIIMVGEIRDEETAGIAVNSALTGHLVLSTIHTNDAATTLPRLIDMKVEPFLVASTIKLIIAQRLIRKICEKCRVSYKINDEIKMILESEPVVKEILQSKGYKNLEKLRLYKGKGCKVCDNTGYIGRIGIFEIMEMTDEIRKMILQRSSSDEITEQAYKDGMRSMMEDGLEKVLEGQTTLEEVIRVARR